MSEGKEKILDEKEILLEEKNDFKGDEVKLRRQMSAETKRFMEVDPQLIQKKLDDLGIGLGQERAQNAEQIRSMFEDGPDGDRRFKVLMRSLLDEVKVREPEDVKSIIESKRVLDMMGKYFRAVRPLKMSVDLKDNKVSIWDDIFNNETTIVKWSSTKRSLMAMWKFFSKGDPSGSSLADSIMYCSVIKTITCLIDDIEYWEGISDHKEFEDSRSLRCADFIIQTQLEFSQDRLNGLWHLLALESAAFKRMMQNDPSWDERLCYNLIYCATIKTIYANEPQEFVQSMTRLEIGSLMKDDMIYRNTIDRISKYRYSKLESMFEGYIDLCDIRIDSIKSKRQYLLYSILTSIFALIVVLNGLFFDNQFNFVG